MALSFQDKIRPVATTTASTAAPAGAPSQAPALSFADKIRTVSKPAVPEKGPVTMSGGNKGQVVPHFDINTNNFGMEHPITDIVKGTAATLGNAVLAAPRAAEQAIRIPGQVKDIFTQNGGEGVYGKYAEGVDSIMKGGGDVVESILNSLSTIGNTALGGIQAGTKKLTGKNFGGEDKVATQTFNNLGNNVADTIKGVAKFGIEDPTTAALTLQQGYQSLTGNPEADLIHKVGGGTINEVKNVASDVKTFAQKQIASPQRVAKSVDKLEEDYYRWKGSTKAGVKVNAKVDARTEALNRAGTTGKAPQRVLAEDGVIPKLNKEGTKFDTVDQANELREKVAPLHDALKDGVVQVDRAVPPTAINDLEAQALERINGLKMPESGRKALITDVKEEFGLMREKYGNNMSASDMQFEKPSYSGSVKYDSTKPFRGDANYQVGKAFQQGIEEMATKGGFEDVAQLNRVIGDKLEAAKFLEGLSGQTLKYGKLGKYVFTAVGSSLGKTVVGKVFGALAGDALGEMLMRADVANPVKRMILNSIQAANPEAYTATLEWLKQQASEQAGRLGLPAPTYTPVAPNGTPNQLPYQGRPIAGNAADLGIIQEESLRPNNMTMSAISNDSNIPASIPKTQYKSKTFNAGQKTTEVIKTLNKEQGGYINFNSEPKASRAQVAKELRLIDTTPVKVNGKIDLTDSNLYFRLEELKAKVLSNKVLTKQEVKEAAGLLQEAGIKFK